MASVTRSATTSNLPDVESRDGFDLLDEQFGGQGTGYTGTIVFRAEQGVDDPEVQAQMQALFDHVAGLDDVTKVDSPYVEGGEQLIASQGPEAGLHRLRQRGAARGERLQPGRRDPGHHPRGVTGDRRRDHRARAASSSPTSRSPPSELLGLAFAIVILIAAFGSVLAMGLPIGVALFGIGLGSALTTLLSNVITIPEFAPFIGVMIGLGVGIDYALLIITRHREQLHAGHDVRESIGIAMDTAGRSVLFAGMTVVISLLGMLLMGVPFVQGLAVSASVTVALTVLASLTLLPALIGFAGERIELTRRRGLIAAGFVALGLVGAGLGISALLVGFPIAIGVLLLGLWLPFLKQEVPHRPPKPRRETLAYRWSRLVQHRPWTGALVGTAILLFLALPVLGLRLGFSDESNFPEDTTHPSGLRPAGRRLRRGLQRPVPARGRGR